ncbi:MAG: hypothetical protein AAFR17_00970 [Pseudomonadota bacterium]
MEDLKADIDPEDSASPARDGRKTRLVVVVHGIGEQAPGECVSLLTASMPEDVAAETSYDIEALEEEGGGPRDREGNLHDQPEIPTLFECHSRRMRTEKTDHIFAEVYWSDVVVTGRGTVDILISLIRVILGLGHIVRESASITYKDHFLMRRLTDAAIYCIHGPIAAINTVLLVGAIVASIARIYVGADLTEDLRWALLIGIPMAGYGLFHMTRSVSYLWRSYWRWMMWSALIMSAMALTISHSAAELPPIDPQADRDVQELQWEDRRAFCTPEQGWTRTALCSTANFLEVLETEALSMICVRVDLLSGGSRTCKSELKGLYLLGVYLLLLQQLAWMVTLTLMTLILVIHMVLWIWSRADPGAERIPALAPVALSAMALMWILLLCCVWAVGFFIDRQFTGNFDLFKAAFFLVWVNWAFALAIALITATIFALPYRAWMRRLKKMNYLIRNPARKTVPSGAPPAEPGLIVHPDLGASRPPIEAPRLIVAVPIAILTMFCPVVLLSLGIVSVLRDRALLFYDVTWMNWMADQSHDYFEWMLAVSALIGLALYGFREQLRVGIGLGSDVINYFRVLDYAPKRGDRHFHFRERIERRFIAVARVMCKRHMPDEVVIVAHSQGTVVALDVLRHGKVADLVETCPNWKLITMGSPFTHIYAKYFPNDFWLPGQEQTGLKQWINIFRIDDFVGTHIGNGHRDWPVEHAVGPRGHTNYWVDIEVAPILRRHLFD